MTTDDGSDNQGIKLYGWF